MHITVAIHNNLRIGPGSAQNSILLFVNTANALMASQRLKLDTGKHNHPNVGQDRALRTLCVKNRYLSDISGCAYSHTPWHANLESTHECLQNELGSMVNG